MAVYALTLDVAEHLRSELYAFIEANWKAQKQHCVTTTWLLNAPRESAQMIYAKLKIAFPAVKPYIFEINLANSVGPPQEKTEHEKSMEMARHMLLKLRRK